MAGGCVEITLVSGVLPEFGEPARQMRAVIICHAGIAMTRPASIGVLDREQPVGRPPGRFKRLFIARCAMPSGEPMQDLRAIERRGLRPILRDFEPRKGARLEL